MSLAARGLRKGGATCKLTLVRGVFSTLLATELSREGDSSWHHGGYILTWRVIMSKGAADLRLAAPAKVAGLQHHRRLAAD